MWIPKRQTQLSTVERIIEVGIVRIVASSGLSELSVIKRCPYGVCKERFLRTKNATIKGMFKYTVKKSLLVSLLHKFKVSWLINTARVKSTVCKNIFVRK